MDRFNNPADAACRPPDNMSDPVIVAQLLEDDAGGLDQQATASQQGSALGGHPFPAFFYGKAASDCRAAAKLIRELSGISSPTTPTVPSSGVAASLIAEKHAHETKAHLEPKPPAPGETIGSLPSGDERAAAKKKG